MQIFHRSTNTISRATIYGAVFLVAALLWAVLELQRSPYITYAKVARPQPVPFSHQHHVGGLGIDCRYCHTSVENSSFAGIPPTKTCMNCHSQIWTGRTVARTSARKLPYRQVAGMDPSQRFARFCLFRPQHSHQQGRGLQHLPRPGRPHAADVQLRVAANGVVPGLPSRPGKNLRPRDQVFNMRYEQPSSDKPVVLDGKLYTDQLSLGTDLVRKYNLRTVTDITSCSTCHR